MRRSIGNALQRLGDDGVHLRVLDRARCIGARSIEQAVQPMLDEASAPLRNRLRRHPLSARGNLVVGAFCTGQSDARSPRQRLCGLTPQGQCRELLTLILDRYQFGLRLSTHRCLVVHTVHG